MKATVQTWCWVMFMVWLQTASPQAFGQEYKIGNVQISIHGASDFGTVVRTNNVDPQLVANANAKVFGIPSFGSTRNGDDGELNFRKPGESTSTTLKGWGSLEAKYGGFGIFVREKGWYDFTLSDHNVQWGNYLNNFATNTPLSDRGFDNRSRFSGLALQQAYVFAVKDVAGHRVDVRIGDQLIPWGIPSAFPGGLSVLNPIDFPALHRAGAFAEETQVPVPAVFVRYAVTPKLSVDGFWQFSAARNVYDGCGTFYGIDYFPQGCNYALANGPSTLPDPQTLRQGYFINRAQTPDNAELGQGGVGARYTLDAIGTDFGAYYSHYNSRSALIELSRTSRKSAATPFIVGNPDGGNPLYHTIYPTGIDMFAANVQTRLASDTELALEYVFRPNQPIALPAGEELTAAVSATAPSLIRPFLSALSPGAFYNGYDRHQTGSLNMSAAQQFHGVISARTAIIGGELGFRQVYDLPNPNVRRYLRADTFGAGPVNGVCPPPAPGVLYTGCTLKGFVTKFAMGFRLRGSLVFAVQSIADLEVILTGTYGRDISGWAYDGAFNEGRSVATAAIRTEYKKAYFGEIVFAPTWGGAFNPVRDRSVVLAAFGARF